MAFYIFICSLEEWGRIRAHKATITPSERLLEGANGEKPSFVVVDAAVGVQREVARNFCRHEKKFALLPYHEELTKELDARFEHIKHGIVIAVLVNEQRPALRNFIFALKT
ncbi:hypothetical protein OSTOST_02263 [Ostertagia ostertagi]